MWHNDPKSTYRIELGESAVFIGLTLEEALRLMRGVRRENNPLGAVLTASNGQILDVYEGPTLGEDLAARQ